ncbi:unnamed protein product [Gordionus sp. m RMFG-2023]
MTKMSIKFITLALLAMIGLEMIVAQNQNCKLYEGNYQVSRLVIASSLQTKTIEMDLNYLRTTANTLPFGSGDRIGDDRPKASISSIVPFGNLRSYTISVDNINREDLILNVGRSQKVTHISFVPS